MQLETIEPKTVAELQALVQQGERFMIQSGRSKNALCVASSPSHIIDMRGLTGIVEYEPGEYTFTALAGTPLREIEAALAVHHQFLPFDPPLVDAGATLGGTVAAGLSGSGRYRYGGVRDFLIGVRFIDGQGRLVRGGGKVVKNAAGFDLPKLMVGSLGQFGILTEVSFKVFPRPEAYATLQVKYTDMRTALVGLQRVIDTHFDVYALDLVVDAATSSPYTLFVRLGGLPDVLSQRLDQLHTMIGAGKAVPTERLMAEAEAAWWHANREFHWVPPATALVKVATTVDKIVALEAALSVTGVARRYSVGGNLLWLAWPSALSALEPLLTEQGVSGLVIRGECSQPFLGVRHGQAFTQRLKQALDPAHRLPTR
ncbi:MAG: FAD-binding protein [Caldilineaceae bacterium]|nr:FAD-binding protein [Caldilineaceae bacterium]